MAVAQLQFLSHHAVQRFVFHFLLLALHGFSIISRISSFLQFIFFVYEHSWIFLVVDHCIAIYSFFDQNIETVNI